MLKRFRYLKKFNTPVLCGGLALVIAGAGVAGWAFAQDTEKLAKALMIELSREQSQVLCQSAEFTSCMGFSEQACLDLSEEALQQCIMPLPDTIILSNLNSEVLEMCPQEVYAKAGYSNEKATDCLLEILDK